MNEPKDKTQIWKLDDGRWFRTIEEITKENGDKLPAGTALHVIDPNSTTKWWLAADEHGVTHKVSKFEGAVPQ